MARRILDDIELYDRVVKMLPKGIPETAIAETFVSGGMESNDGIGYWVYTDSGYLFESSCTHSDFAFTLSDLKKVCKTIYYDPNDKGIDYIPE